MRVGAIDGIASQSLPEVDEYILVEAGGVLELCVRKEGSVLHSEFYILYSAYFIGQVGEEHNHTGVGNTSRSIQSISHEVVQFVQGGLLFADDDPRIGELYKYTIAVSGSSSQIIITYFWS
jgi:hypothetical protein